MSKSDYHVDEIDGASQRKSEILSAVGTQRKSGVRNEISVRMRDTTVSVSGWKACAVETLALGLMVAGAYFVVTNAKDTAASATGRITALFRRS